MRHAFSQSLLRVASVSNTVLLGPASVQSPDCISCIDVSDVLVHQNYWCTTDVLIIHPASAHACAAVLDVLGPTAVLHHNYIRYITNSAFLMY